jgi:hypothetical protein
MTTTTFYGACDVCGRGYWADVATGPGRQMCGPRAGIVCQAHHPVADVHLDNSEMFSHEDRQKWSLWRAEAERALRAAQDTGRDRSTG